MRVAIYDRFRELARGDSWGGSNTITNITRTNGASRVPVGRLLQIIPLDGPQIGSTALMRIDRTSGATVILSGALAA
jgi:hypothetical protein